MSRVQLALTGLVLFCVGGLVGAAVVNKPPPPVATTSHVKQDAALASIAAHEARTDDNASVFRVLPEVKITKRKTTYRPPVPQLPPFPGSPQVCNCPNVGVIASVEETTTEMGKGTEAINTASTSNVKSAAASSLQLRLDQNLTTKPTQAPASRLSLGLGVSTQLTDPADKAKLGAAASVGFRIFNNGGLRITTDLPLHAPVRASLMWEWRP